MKLTAKERSIVILKFVNGNSVQQIQWNYSEIRWHVITTEQIEQVLRGQIRTLQRQVRGRLT